MRKPLHNAQGVALGITLGSLMWAGVIWLAYVTITWQSVGC